MYARGGITLPRAFITVAKVLCSEGTCKVISPEGEVENNISIVEMLERLPEKWHVVFNAVSSFIKLMSSFDNDFEYNLQRNAKQFCDDKEMAKAYLTKASDLFSAGDARYAYWEDEFRKRRDSAGKLRHETKRSFKDLLERYQRYVDALGVFQQWFPSEDVQHLIKSCRSKFMERLLNALKIFGLTVEDYLAWEEVPVKVEKPVVDDDNDDDKLTE